MQAEDRSNIVEIASRLLLRRHVDSWHALGWACMSTPEESAIRLFALQDWSQWPCIESHVVSAMPFSFYSRTAACDAMSRILWRLAEVSQERRALQLSIRASDYRRATRHAESIIRGLLLTASISYLAALASRDGFAPSRWQAANVEQACTPGRPQAAQRHGLQTECRRAA